MQCRCCTPGLYVLTMPTLRELDANATYRGSLCLQEWCCAVRVCVQGAPEGILERCTKARIAGRDTVELDDQMKEDILDIVRRYGSGADTLRCLALAVVDDPTKPEDMDLEDAGNFVKYEVCSPGVRACVRACDHIYVCVYGV